MDFFLRFRIYWGRYTKWRIRESNHRKPRKTYLLSWRDAGMHNSDLQFPFPFGFQLEYSRSAVQQTNWKFRDTWRSGCLTLYHNWSRHNSKWRNLWANSWEEWGQAVASAKYQELLQPWKTQLSTFKKCPQLLLALRHLWVSLYRIHAIIICVHHYVCEYIILQWPCKTETIFSILFIKLVFGKIKSLYKATLHYLQT